jgi:acetoin:2,6-dichlorophenolindophenol oxidoreductase subunit alpha
MDLLSAYRAMLRIRVFEERVLACAARGLVPGAVHPYTGQEAVAVGVLSARRRKEWIVSFYRCHGHALAAGSAPEALLCEILGRDGGVCGGRGGSMHLADRAHRLLGSTSIVGAQLPIAAGAAMAEQLDQTGRAVLVFCGDGALGAGGSYEALTIAAARGLPLLVVCEDNGWQDRTPSPAVRHRPPAELVAGLGLPVVEVDGNDVTAVYEAADIALRACRLGGPRVLVAHTYLRDFHAQLGAEPPAEYRPDAERADWQTRDPLVATAGMLTDDSAAIDRLTAVYDDVVAEMDGALERALDARAPDAAAAGASVTAWRWST